MTRREIKKEYFEWMVALVSGGRRTYHMRLLKCLHTIDFTYSIEMDGNRAEDGIDLRYRFGTQRNIPHPIIASLLDDMPCSVLEMMIALSMRCEEHIMSNSDAGDRTGKWFWAMVDSLGLGEMTDRMFDEEHALKVIERFLDRRYTKNGKGGLFYIPRCGRDMRTAEIWYQMMWYLSEVVKA